MRFVNKAIILMMALLFAGFANVGCGSDDQSKTHVPSNSDQVVRVVQLPLTAAGAHDPSDDCPGVDNPADYPTGQWCNTWTECTERPTITPTDGSPPYKAGVECVRNSYSEIEDTLVPLDDNTTCVETWQTYWHWNDMVGWGTENSEGKLGLCMVQSDLDRNGFGNSCGGDRDGDHICDPGYDRDNAMPYDQTVCQGVDNCPDESNAEQNDSDGDLLGDKCDPSCKGEDLDERTIGPFIGDLYCGDDDNFTREHFPNMECFWCNDNDDCNSTNTCVVGECDDGTCEYMWDPENDDENCTAAPPPDCVEDTACDDGINCTKNDWCNNGVCAGVQRACDDLNFCTTDSCNEQAGMCSNIAVSTNDNNPCTDDACNPANGAVTHTPNTASCADGDTCDGAEVCSGGVCPASGTPMDCDDANACTNDGCSANACTHTNNSASCQDNVWCNGADTCGGGSCSVHAGNPCVGQDTGDNCADSCNEATDQCNLNDTAHACNDANSCTTSDTCSSGQCVGTAVQNCGACNGTTCAEGEACQGEDEQQCVAATEALWCWDDGQPPSCQTGTPGYFAPNLWKFATNPSTPPACTGTSSPQRLPANPACCVSASAGFNGCGTNPVVHPYD